MPTLLRLGLVAVLAGCGGDDSPADAPTDDAEDTSPSDAASDASTDASASDASSDAATPSVEAVTCAGSPPTVRVNGSGTDYQPDTVTIPAGEMVKFEMPGSHTVRSGPPGQFSELFAVDRNQTACLRFNVAGTYPFFCSPHLFAGEIVVTP